MHDRKRPTGARRLELLRRPEHSYREKRKENKDRGEDEREGALEKPEQGLRQDRAV